METTRSLARLVMALAMAFGIPHAASAAPLLSRTAADGTAAALPGVRRSARLALDSATLATLRTKSSAAVEGFPLGAGRRATLDLRRVSPFGPRTRAEIMEAGGPRALALPDAAYFTGTVRGEPASRVVLVARAAAVHGFVASGDQVYRFGPDGHGIHRSYALADVEPGAYPPPGAFCLNDAHPHLAAAMKTAPAAASPVAAATLLHADVAIETDRELRTKFTSDQDALAYLGELLAAATAIYERDVGVQLGFSYIRLWGAAPADPWTSSDPLAALDEVQAYWLNPANNMDAIAGSHDIVHFISGKDVSGGVAYVGTVCNGAYGFGVSQVKGDFDLASPSTVWDVLVFTHEVGHNFGSPHTHCYSPPIDRCYNAETAQSCYKGPVVFSRGTIMSYCHLLGGVENVDLLFGSTVSSQIVGTIGGVSCLSAADTGTCGNAVIEGNEQCDDGAVVAGDGCSTNCRFEVCGNRFIDPGEACDDGNTVTGDGCSPTCQREPICGDATVDPGEQCDDGNAVSGDGCSVACLTEPCLVVRSGQTVWAKAKVSVKKPGTTRAGLSMTGVFSLGLAVEQLGLATDGARLVLENGAGARRVDVTLPAGPLWVVRPGKWIYRDPAGTSGGIRKVVIRDRTRGGVPDVQVKFTGQGTYALAPEDLPLVLTLVLGDDAAGHAGACGRFAFDGGSCRATRSASRITCR